MLRTLLCIATLAATTLPAQEPSYPSAWNPSILARADVKAAFKHLEQGFPKQVDEWVAITEMVGKSRHEQQRGEYVRKAMLAEGLRVSVDSLGNVTGIRKGSGGGPTIAFAAHMDIVHDLDISLKVRRSGDTLHAPGVWDNSASVANMLATIRALNAAKLVTRGDLIFIGTVQEEIGIRGMDYWLKHNPRPDLLIAIDGGLGPVSYGALGIYWTRYFYTSPGSHTLLSRGKPTPVKALATAVDELYRLQFPPLSEGAVMNIGQVHGGVIFNGIPQELYFTVDLRSPDPVLLDSLDRRIEQIARSAAEKEKVGFRVEIDTRNQAGGTTAMLAGARAHPLVQTAVDIQRALGISVGMPGAAEAVASGATDANPGVVRKIPSIAVGRAYGANGHTVTEWADWPSALPATKMLVLLVASLGDGAKGLVP
ncbi:MAG: M20/M25/M40 family metallo-hydrolase [Gemmatimonadota bacterium]